MIVKLSYYHISRTVAPEGPLCDLLKELPGPSAVRIVV